MNQGGNPLRFRTPDGYESWRAERKHDWLWNECIVPTEYEKLPELAPLPPRQMVAAIAGCVRKTKLAGTLERQDDLMEPGRPKIIHTHGAVASIRWEVEPGSDFTGMLGLHGRAVQGIVRFSYAAPPSLGSYVPGLAIKLFVDGRPSVDLVAVNHVDGQGKDPNPFSHVLSHDLREEYKTEKRPQRIMRFFFNRVADDPGLVTIDHFAGQTCDGEGVFVPSVPHRLSFVPNREVARIFDAQGATDFRLVFNSVPAGTELHRVVSHDGATVARIVTASRFVASSGGDRLFFRHVQDGAASCPVPRIPDEIDLSEPHDVVREVGA